MLFRSNVVGTVVGTAVRTVLWGHVETMVRTIVEIVVGIVVGIIIVTMSEHVATLFTFIFFDSALDTHGNSANR